MQTIYYTHEYDTSDSTVFDALYIDDKEDYLWFVFPNGTVVARSFPDLTTAVVDEVIEGARDSLGKAWNSNFKHWSVPVDNTDVESVEFVKRDAVAVTAVPTDSAWGTLSLTGDAGKAIASSPSMTVTINVRGLGLLDLHAVADALDLAGIDADIHSAESW